jgi:hypothetical protein
MCTFVDYFALLRRKQIVQRLRLGPQWCRVVVAAMD